MKIHMDIKNMETTSPMKSKSIIANNKFQKIKKIFVLLVSSYCSVLIISFAIDDVINFEINLSFLIK